MKKSEIKFIVSLDDKNIPEKIEPIDKINSGRVITAGDSLTLLYKLLFDLLFPWKVINNNLQE